MSTRRSRVLRAALVPSLLLQGLLILLLLPAVVVGAEECELSVTPSTGRAGTEFTFSGSGYSPSKLTLIKEGGAESTVDVTPMDPFTIKITAQAGDEGEWTARAWIPETECVGEATFTVQLPPTDALTDASPGQPAAPAVVFVVLMGAAVALGAGYSMRGMIVRR